MEFQFDLFSFAVGLAVFPLLHLAAFSSGSIAGYAAARRSTRGKISDLVPSRTLGDIAGINLSDAYN